MADFIGQCKKWFICIQKLDLETVITGFENFVNLEPDAENNKYLFKLLLYLSHCADRCYREKLDKETLIFIVANNICRKLLTPSDPNKFFSALYYVLYYLLSRQYFKEAKIISNYLLPGKIFKSADLYKSSEYYQVSSIWHSEMFKKLDEIIANSEISKVEVENTEEDFCTYIRFHLQILKFCDETLCYTFKTAGAYVTKLANIPLATAFPYLLEIFKHLTSYIMNLKKLPVPEAYNLTITVLGLAFFKRNDAINNQKILNFFRQCDCYFVDCLKTTGQCYDYYRLFREYTINLLETNFMSNGIGELRMKKCSEVLNILIQKYGVKNNSLIETITAIAYSFETLFTNWENLVSKQLASTNINYDNIFNMGDFVKRVHSILKNRQFPTKYVCKKCSESAKCSMKKDNYNAAIVTSTFIRVIAKLDSNNLNEKLFLIAKELLDELVLIFNELEQAGCQYYSSALWDLCGRMIFNIGLISEAKYPMHLEKLYEVLCTQTILKDGLNSKVSSFGLENPVAVTLHRLCNINFYQEKYKKAMIYTAYNALFSNSESRKKKAHDMWANIKFKLIDSKEIQELTMLKCLKTDNKVVKNLAISIDLQEYDLNDLCLRELKSLCQMKGNMMVSMKKTIDELESTNSALHYAQGVILLAFHSLHFKKRGFISEYISKAIEKLTSLKIRTPNNQCLLANLNFYNVIEKFYARSQVINKQIDDANFTVKAFKAFKGKRLYDETDDENEVIPTYGGINIEEDGRCAKELRNIIVMWEKCMQKNLVSLSVDCFWEPKYTLELIVICGEYCRLYKFNNNEEKSWKLAYQLATALQDITTCIYVTSRSISLRCINDNWISQCEKYVENIKDFSKPNETDVVALFWLSLADFYCDCKQIEEAKILLEKVKSMPNYTLLHNTKLYIYSNDIQFRNYYLINTKTSQDEYSELLVKIHYSMISLHDIVDQDSYRLWTMRYYFFSCEQLFECMYNTMIPMNSLLSYREVSAHLTNGLKLAQKFGMTLRIAQYLKHLCYIDLLRTQVEDCETRLQDLEHILYLEHFQASMNTKFHAQINEQLAVQRIRDAAPINFSKNSGSPELKRKIFSEPDFLAHTTYCECFFCSNLNYQYMTFSCAHLRAQLYSLLNYTKEAELYFHGACKIKLRVEERDEETRMYNNYKWKRNQNFTIDIILYLLDFSMYIYDFKPNLKEQALALIEEALEIGSENDLSHHSVCLYASELYFQHYIYDKFHNKLNISVPLDIPINITNQSADGCITPKQQIEKTTRNPRRRKSPVPIAVPVITIDDSDVENNCGNSPIPKASSSATGSSKSLLTRRVSARNVRRKILVDEIEAMAPGKEEPKLVRKRSTRLSRK